MAARILLGGGEAKAETSAIALSAAYLSSWARSKTVDALECSLIGPGRRRP
jgi:hypothetical protein